MLKKKKTKKTCITMRFDYVLETLGYSRINIEHDWECLCDYVEERKKITLPLISIASQLHS